MATKYGLLCHQNQRFVEYIGTLYRQQQIFVILSDECFQSYIWPATQFFGAVVLITVLYVLLIFERSLTLLGTLVTVVFAISTASINCLLLGMGSKSISISGKILHRIKYWDKNEGHKWSRRFFRSCPKIAIRVGEFHKMDNGRAPAFIRFVLQRTFFLVIKTKLNLGNHVSGMDISFS